MQNAIFSQVLDTKSATVNNAIIQLGDIDNSGKGRHFKSRFIKDGLVKIEGHGIVLLKKETLDASLPSMVGAPVIIKHQDITEDNADELRCGTISNAYFNEPDGWYYCEGIIWDKKAQELIENQGWSVSCSYDFLSYNDKGGVENNIKYDKEFTNLNFTHLAIVDNPRYERANIVFNCKVNNGGNGSGNPDQKRNELGQWCEDYNTIAKDIKSYCESKGYIVKKDKSKSTNSIYLKLYKNDKDLSNHTYFKAIRLSDHESEQGDKDIMLKYSDNLENMKKVIDDNLSNKVNEDILKDFDGVIIDYNKIHPELNFEGLDIPQIKKQIENFYNKYLKTFNKSENTLNLSKDGIDLGFSNRFLNVLTTYKDFKLVQVLLSNIEDIVDKGKLETISQHKKRLKIPIFDDNTFYNLELPIEQDNRGNWVIDVLKMNINNSQGTKGKPSPQSLTANNIVNHFNNNLNPKTDNCKQNVTKETVMTLIEELKKLITRVENEKGEQDMNEKEKVDNKKVDKRKLIDEVGGILKGKVDDEIIRTIMKKMEEASYNGSEDDKAGNEKEEDKKDDKKEDIENKCKNETEEDKKEFKEIKEEVKEDIDNKCKNSKPDTTSFDKINAIYNSVKTISKPNKYVSRQEKLDDAVKYFS